MMIKKLMGITLCSLLALSLFSCTMPATENFSGASRPKDSAKAAKDDSEALEEDETEWTQEEDAAPAPEEEYTASQGMTAVRMDEVYALMQAHGFEVYAEVYGEEWHALSPADKEAFAESLRALLTGLGAQPNSMEPADIINSYDTWYYDEPSSNWYFQDVWTVGSFMLDVPGFAYYSSLYRYKTALEAGEVAPVPESIMAVADSFSVRAYEDSYLLCLGADHLVSYITKEWATKENSFMYSGSVRAFESDDFSGLKDFSYSGGDGVIGRIELDHKTDILPVLSAMGAAAEDGTILHDPIDFCAFDEWDAQQIFVLSKDGDGLVHIAMLQYNSMDDIYEWDGNVYQTAEVCCFSDDGAFHYIDENGMLQTIS